VDPRAVGEIESHHRVIFTNGIDSVDPFALVKKPTAHVYDRLIQNPKRGIDQMNSKIDNATAASLHRTVKPGLLRTVSIMKNKIDSENLTELISPDELP